MLYQLTLGGLLTLVTVIFHAASLAALVRLLLLIRPTLERLFAIRWHMVVTVAAVCAVFTIHAAEIWIWALAYLSLGILANLETSLYFSTATFTTLGYGDITLGPQWRLLGAAQGADGFVLFGWSTAFIFEVMTRSWQRRSEQTGHGLS